MTQEPDWAYREAAEIDVENGVFCTDHITVQIAAALRRAKAEGLREAANLSGSLPDCIEMHTRADLLDPPTPI